jgi:hypothetical protein
MTDCNDNGNGRVGNMEVSSNLTIRGQRERERKRERELHKMKIALGIFL